MKKFMKMAMVAIATLGAASCSNYESVYDPDFNLKEYNKSFEETFGAIPQGQSWDFYAQNMRAIKSRGAEGVEVNSTIGQPDGADFTTWQTLLKSGYDNSTIGMHDYTLFSPANGKFKVYAVWYAGWYPYYKKFGFEMGLVVDGEKVKLFDGAKSEDEVVADATGQAFSVNPGYGAEVEIPAGTPFTFYMSYNLYGTIKTIYSNTGSSTLLYSNLSTTGNQVMVVGFEDSAQDTWNKTKPDFNDIVLYIEGNPELPVAQSKRFMCEDLGLTGDFDFNDVVFDVRPSSEEGKLNVTLQAAGGTLPAVLTVAGQEIGEVHGLFGVSTATMVNTIPGSEVLPPYSVDIELPEGYGPFDFTNFTDFKITVTNTDGSKRDIVYREDGTAPATIITPISNRWMQETVNIKEGYPLFFEADWFKTSVPEKLY